MLSDISMIAWGVVFVTGAVLMHLLVLGAF